MISSALAALTATTGNRTDCWNTPPDFVGDVIKFFGTIDLDPCSNDENNPNVPATKVYTEETNGLAHKWIADRVFMNHPYSCLLYTSPSPRDVEESRMPSSA